MSITKVTSRLLLCMGMLLGAYEGAYGAEQALEETSQKALSPFLQLPSVKRALEELKPDVRAKVLGSIAQIIPSDVEVVNEWTKSDSVFCGLIAGFAPIYNRASYNRAFSPESEADCPLEDIAQEIAVQARQLMGSKDFWEKEGCFSSYVVDILFELGSERVSMVETVSSLLQKKPFDNGRSLGSYVESYHMYELFRHLLPLHPQDRNFICDMAFNFLQRDPNAWPQWSPSLYDPSRILEKVGSDLAYIIENLSKQTKMDSGSRSELTANQKHFFEFCARQEAYISLPCWVGVFYLFKGPHSLVSGPHSPFATPPVKENLKELWALPLSEFQKRLADLWDQARPQMADFEPRCCPKFKVSYCDRAEIFAKLLGYEAVPLHS